MPVLANVKHERFAQEIAKGASSREAYGLAGFSTSSDAATDAGASRLLSTAKVKDRVAEILGRAATRAEISVAGLTERLMRLADKGEALCDASGIQASRASIMDAAKLNGMVTDKAKLDIEGDIRTELTIKFV